MIKQIHSIEKSVLVDPHSVDAAALGEPAQEIEDRYLVGSEMPVSLCHFGRDACSDRNGNVVACQVRGSADSCRQCWIAPAGNPHSPVSTRNPLTLLDVPHVGPVSGWLLGPHLYASGLRRAAVFLTAFSNNRPFSQARCKNSPGNANQTDCS